MQGDLPHHDSRRLTMTHDVDLAREALRIGASGYLLMLGLEILVAADIIRTVALAPTQQNVLILGLLAVIRTFLSWGLVVEIEERWPWQPLRVESASRAEPTGKE